MTNVDSVAGARDLGCNSRANQLYEEHMQPLYVRTDRMFAVLMLVQWAFAVIVALWLSPFEWEGSARRFHTHVWMAVILGGILTVPAIFAATWLPGRRGMRHLIALSQVAFSSLLIHVTGGRIETHFHVFGSLAFLAAYRDWTVLVPATALVAVDHLVRGMLLPETVFGIAAPGNWRWLEHAGWVLFEDFWLVICCRQGIREVQDIARHRAELEQNHTALQTQTDELEQLLVERKEFEASLKQAKESAESANHSKSLFLASMSHEIRTPLNAIIGFTDLLRSGEGQFSAEEQRSHLEAVHQGGAHLLTVINDILDLSKIEAGQMHYERLSFSPHQILADTLSFMRVRAIEKGITLDARWLGRVPETIISDPARVRQLLFNLVGNAIKFTERGGVQILARINPTEEQLQLDIIDTGVGIPADKMSSIFDPFTQADISVTRRFGGTGLGLSICRHIVEALGGRISVQSVEGHGSTFTITLSTGNLSAVQFLDTPHLETLRVTADPATIDTYQLTGMRILIVDDGKINRQLLQVLLKRTGAEIALAENGAEAVELATKLPFDLILMDMQMPVLDGYSATRRLRTLGIKTHIIALTAHAMSGEEQKCRAAGCDGYLSKPVSRIDLMDALLAIRQAAAPSPSAQPCPDQSEAIEPPLAPIEQPDLSDPSVREIVREFIADLGNELSAIHSLWEKRDWSALGKRVHSLKGSSGMTGLADLYHAVCRLEKHVRKQDPSKVEQGLAELDSIAAAIVPPDEIVVTANAH